MSPQGEAGGGWVRVYVASKSNHGGMWQALRTDHPELDVVSTWIDENGPGDSPDLSDLWVRCTAEAASVDVLIAYHEPGETWKGAFVEIGVALSNGIPIVLVGDPPGSWVNHPLVHRVGALPGAVTLAKVLTAADPVTVLSPVPTGEGTGA